MECLNHHKITLTVDGLGIPFIATTQEASDGFIEIVGLVLKGPTDLQALSLLLDYNINNQAYDQIEAIYKEAK
jgi:hypothetical protein